MRTIFLFIFLSISILGNTSLKEINKSFDEIGDKYDIPSQFLKAIALKNSHWKTDISPERGRYGIMGLRLKNFKDSIEEGERLTGFVPELGISDYKINIEMAASILRNIKNSYKERGYSFKNLEDYLPVLYDFVDLGDDLEYYTYNFIRKIYEKISYGYEIERDDDYIKISPERVDLTKTDLRKNTPIPPSTVEGPESLKNRPGLDFIWKSAHSNNYTVENRTASTIDMVVNHQVEGSYEGCVSWFASANNDRYTSAHYCMSDEGEITQMVKIKDKAHHAGTRNMRAIGIEHEGRSTANLFTQVEYETSAILVRWLADTYGVVTNNDPVAETSPGVVRHHSNCPGPYWNWTLYMSLLNSAGNSPHSGTVKFTRPLEGQTVDNPVVLRSIGSEYVASVKYFAESDYQLGESSDKANDFEYVYTYSGVDRVREIWVKGYDSEGLLIESAVDHITFTPTEGGSGTITLLKPQNNTTLRNPVQFEASVSGDIVKVDYYAETHYLETVESPYTYEREFTTTGERVVYAYGLNANGVILDVKSAKINVKSGYVYFIKPLNGSTIENPVQLEARVGGTVTKVEYFAENYSLGVFETAPFSHEREFTTFGGRTLHAVGLDSNGIEIDRDTINITLNETVNNYSLSFTNISNNDSYENPISIKLSASEEIVKIELMENNSIFAELINKPFEHSQSFSEGSHTITAKGYLADNTLVKEISITFNVTNASTETELYFLDISEGASFKNPVKISLFGSGDIKQVKLYDGPNVIGIMASSPFSGNYELTEGEHSIVARGYDSTGTLVKTTPAITIVVETKTVSSDGSSSGCSFNYEENHYISGLFLILLAFSIAFFRRKSTH
ncbi:N-acetylmuramoyl-L-alanine amidase [bacterium]|nr:N-acetylmuramoyl-L-alanine amidase [bacterium]